MFDDGKIALRFQQKYCYPLENNAKALRPSVLGRHPFPGLARDGPSTLHFCRIQGNGLRPCTLVPLPLDAQTFCITSTSLLVEAVLSSQHWGEIAYNISASAKSNIVLILGSQEKGVNHVILDWPPNVCSIVATFSFTMT